MAEREPIRRETFPFKKSASAIQRLACVRMRGKVRVAEYTTEEDMCRPGRYWKRNEKCMTDHGESSQHVLRAGDSDRPCHARCFNPSVVPQRLSSCTCESAKGHSAMLPDLRQEPNLTWRQEGDETLRVLTGREYRLRGDVGEQRLRHERCSRHDGRDRSGRMCAIRREWISRGRWRQSRGVSPGRSVGNSRPESGGSLRGEKGVLRGIHDMHAARCSSEVRWWRH
jgi:hypothetical protein